MAIRVYIPEHNDLPHNPDRPDVQVNLTHRQLAQLTSLLNAQSYIVLPPELHALRHAVSVGDVIHLDA